MQCDINIYIFMYDVYFAYSVVRHNFPGERQVYIEARFGGLEVTLGDEHGDILSADMTGMCNTLHVMKEPIFDALVNDKIEICMVHMLIKIHHMFKLHCAYFYM